MKKPLIFAVKLSFVSLACYLIFKSIDTKEVFALLKQLSAPFFLLAVFICILDKVIMGAKWNILLRIYDINVPITIPVIANLKAKVFQLFTPSSFGEDVYKTYFLKKYGAPLLQTISSIFIERFFGAFSSLAIITLLLYFSLKKLQSPYLYFLTALGIFAFFALWYFLHCIVKLSSRFNVKIQFPVIPGKLALKLNEFIAALSLIHHHKDRIWAYYAYSIFEKIFYGTAIFFCAKSLNLHDLDYFFIISATPLLALLERLPISISAIGIKEGLFVVLFSQFNIDPTISITVALVLRLAEIAMIIICLFLWFGKHDGKSYESELQTIGNKISALRTGQ